MTAHAEFIALCRDIERSFPDDARTAAIISPALTELARALEAGDFGAATPILDLLEDLLEARMHEAGWPAPTQTGARP